MHLDVIPGYGCETDSDFKSFDIQISFFGDDQVRTVERQMNSWYFRNNLQDAFESMNSYFYVQQVYSNEAAIQSRNILSQ